MHNVIMNPTRNTVESSSLIDLVVTTRLDLVSTMGVFPLRISDHDLIYATIRLKNIRLPSRVIKVRDSKKMYLERFKSDIEYATFQVAFTFDDTDDVLLYVIRTLEEKQLSLTHVSTWDFSTLYTSLPHARLKNQLHDLLERVFHTKGKSFIATNSFRTFWTNDRTSMRYTYFSCRALFSGRLLVYQWAPIAPLCWLISSFIPSSTISWSKQ